MWISEGIGGIGGWADDSEVCLSISFLAVGARREGDKLFLSIFLLSLRPKEIDPLSCWDLNPSLDAESGRANSPVPFGLGNSALSVMPIIKIHVVLFFPSSSFPAPLEASLQHDPNLHFKKPANLNSLRHLHGHHIILQLKRKINYHLEISAF